MGIIEELERIATEMVPLATKSQIFVRLDRANHIGREILAVAEKLKELLPEENTMTTKSWKDAETYADLRAAGITGFIFPDNADEAEAEVVAAVKESLARLEAGDFDIVADIDDGDLSRAKSLARAYEEAARADGFSEEGLTDEQKAFHEKWMLAAITKLAGDEIE